MSHVAWISKTILGWLLLPCVFILTYVYGFHQPETAIQPHLIIAFWLALSMTSLAVLVINTAGPSGLLFHAYMVLCAGLVVFMCLYYVFVLFGIKTWANVITLDLIRTYIQQLPQFSRALGIPLWPAIPIAALLFLLFYLLMLNFHLWATPRAFSARISKGLLLSLLAAVVLFFSSKLKGELLAGQVEAHEPLALTLCFGCGGNNHYATQGMKINPKWNGLEEEARKSYIRSSDEGKKKNIIIIVPDALRQDHMSVYGYGRDTTPWLRTMAEAGKVVLFNNTYSTCAETTCAHASMLGSRHIRELPDKIFSLQEVLKINGYQTRMIIGGDHVNFYNIREIYGDVDDYYDGSMAPGYYINDDQLVLDKTRSLPEWDGQPIFMHYHLLSNHVLGKRFENHQVWKPFKPYYGVTQSEPRQEYINFYDNGVLQTDSVIKELLEVLGRKGYLENTLVIITSDHGDGLGEHQLMNHTNSVYQEVLNVPLIFIPYGYSSGIRNDGQPPVSLIDIAPTVLTEAGMPIPVTWQGSSLQGEMARRHLFFMMQPAEGLYDMQNDGLWKYWRNRLTGEEFVFDLKSDPDERNNLALTAPNGMKQRWRDVMQSVMD